MKIRGVCSAVLAEIMAARAAVLFAHDLGVTHLEVQGEAMMVINALQNDAATPCNGTALGIF